MTRIATRACCNLPRVVGALFFLVPAAPLALSVAPINALAAGLAVDYQSPSSAARGAVGAAAGLQDASTIFYNPATMTLLERTEGLISFGVVYPRFRYTDKGSVDATGAPMRASGSSKDETWIVPSIFAVLPALPGGIRAGIAVTAPFGQSITYDRGWPGRYFITDAELKTTNVTVALAWKPADRWSVGGGIDWQHAVLTRAASIDFGAVCFGFLGPSLCPAIGLVPQGADGRVELDASSDAWGYNLGMVYEKRGSFRFGLTYRSPFRQDLRGMAAFEVPAAAKPLLISGAFQDTGVSGTLELPESVSAGLQVTVGPMVDAIIGATWTRWSRIRELLVVFDNPAQPTVQETLEWRDRIRFGAAIEYRPREELTVQSGLAWDPSPITDERRQPLLPDSDWLVFGVGLTWKVTPAVVVATSYNYSYGGLVSVSQTLPLAGTLTGSYKNKIQGIGVSAALRF